MTVSAPDFAALTAKLDGVALAADNTTARTEKPISDDRRWIAQTVLWSFFGCTAVVLFATIYMAIEFPVRWEEPAKAMLAIVQLLLPVVTLVIGFYFRSESR